MINIYAPQPTDALSPDELELYSLIMAYRAANGLPGVPLSRALTTTAGRHALDTVENQGEFVVGAPGEYKAHGWSDAPYDGRNAATYPSMWEAPQRLGTGYDVPGSADYGYEISIGYLGTNTPPMTPSVALQGWQSSPGHDDVILSRNVWSRPDLEWKAIGVGIYEGVSHVWFGAMTDPTGAPDHITGNGTQPRSGSDGNDTLTGTNFSDLFRGGLGNDTIHGERGVDTAIFNGLRSQYMVQYAGHGNRYTVTGPDGTDLLTSVERLRFSDGDRWVEDAAGQFNVVNRFLNTANGTHFYTASNFEAGSIRSNLAHFENEGLAFKVAPVGASNTADVYRFFNSQKGSHLYTTSTVERDHILSHLPNYRYENVAYKAYAVDDGPQEELYRFYNKRTDTHFFTVSEVERDHVMSSLPDYVYEGIAFYVDPI
ncbi:hypothetical protein [Sabulicella glaciei]|uniref:DUF5648 domain-containing protein n=1 Tax=Sabulicella glaciei TaxID=2984948 RepID=A0ABT3P3U4_9PROT|nr:hypothetical protein [Roseococcus sp. MDT2-1-1]MCW8088449.1 hypothetical protein [Roseococcus sp. MDT2-1-1]